MAARVLAREALAEHGELRIYQLEDGASLLIEVLREAMRRHESATVVLRNYRKDGTLFFNELAIAPVASPDGQVQHYVGILNDVSERERARMAIAERSARLNAVFDLSPDGFVVFDREGQMVYCNQAFVQMTGWDASQGCDIVGFDRQFVALCNPAQAYVPVAASVAATPSVSAPVSSVSGPTRSTRSAGPTRPRARRTCARTRDSSSRDENGLVT